MMYFELENDYKAAFSVYERNIIDNAIYKSVLYCWIKKGLENQKEEMLKLIDSEFDFLV